MAGQDSITYTPERHQRRSRPTRSASVVTDELPAGVTFVSASAGCTYAAADARCDLLIGTLAPRRHQPLRSRSASKLHAGHAPTTHVSITTTTDPGAANATATPRTPPSSPCADVSITKDDGDGERRRRLRGPGESLGLYTLTVSNGGPSDAQGVLRQRRAAGELTRFELFCPTAPPPATATLRSACDRSSTLAAWPPTRTIKIMITVDSPANVATITSDEFATADSTTDDPEDDNNTDTEDTASLAESRSPRTTVTATRSRRLRGPRSSPVRTASRYTLTVSNDGPSDAQAVVVTDALPAGVTVGSAAPQRPPRIEDCDARHGSPRAPAPTRPIIGHASTARPLGTITKRATITSDTDDPRCARRHTDTEETEVIALRRRLGHQGRRRRRRGRRRLQADHGRRRSGLDHLHA